MKQNNLVVLFQRLPGEGRISLFGFLGALIGIVGLVITFFTLGR